ncbi:hypothetical protein [Tenacibaculum sp. 190524A05c]|uniref:hypothetical protein n=1 Tax=Tenacibaculum platacis TaxID=3137852 RepID=UPI0032B110BB
MKEIEIEIERMIHFLYRMNMYIVNINKENIVSFVHGVDIGKLDGPLWTKSLNDFITKKHGINGKALGWSYQIDLYIRKEKLKWSEGFKNLMIEMILESDQIELTEKIVKQYKYMLIKDIDIEQKRNS